MNTENIGSVQQAGQSTYGEKKETSSLVLKDKPGMSQAYGDVKVVTDAGEVSLNNFVDESEDAKTFLDSYGSKLLKDDPKTLELMNKMRSGETLTDKEKQQLYEGICKAVQNHFSYESDNGEEYATFQESVNQLLGVDKDGQPTGELGTINGDCEDPDIFTANLLYAMGFKSDEVNIHVDVGTVDAPGHSVLGLTLGGETNVHDFSGNTKSLDGFEVSYNDETVTSDQDYTLGGEDGLSTASWFSDAIDKVGDFFSGDDDDDKTPEVSTEDTVSKTEDTSGVSSTTLAEDMIIDDSTKEKAELPKSTGGLHVVG